MAESFDYRGAMQKVMDRAKQLTTEIEQLCDAFTIETGMSVDGMAVRKGPPDQHGHFRYDVKANLGMPAPPP